MSKAEESETGGKAMGRPPADEPDVYVFVPEVHVGKLEIDVERLDAHLALQAEVANLVKLVAGVHVGLDKVKIDLEDVTAECELKVRLENTYNILDRTLTTLDENPEIVQKLLETADSAVETTGQIGQQATKPGGALSELTSGVGDTLGNLGNSIGDGLSTIAGKGSPKQLMSGGEVQQRISNGSDFTKRAAAAGAIGLIGGALVGLANRNGNGGVGKRISEGAQADHRLIVIEDSDAARRACGDRARTSRSTSGWEAKAVRSPSGPRHAQNRDHARRSRRGSSELNRGQAADPAAGKRWRLRAWAAAVQPLEPRGSRPTAWKHEPPTGPPDDRPVDGQAGRLEAVAAGSCGRHRTADRVDPAPAKTARQKGVDHVHRHDPRDHRPHPPGDLPLPPHRLAERERVALDPGGEAQLERVVTRVRQVDEPVQALLGDRRLAAVDVLAGVGGGDRLAVEQHLQ